MILLNILQPKMLRYEIEFLSRVNHPRTISSCTELPSTSSLLSGGSALPCSRGPTVLSFEECRPPRPQRSGGSSGEQWEDNNLDQEGGKKKRLGAKRGEEEGGEDLRKSS